MFYIWKFFKQFFYKFLRVKEIVQYESSHSWKSVSFKNLEISTLQRVYSS